MPIKRDARLAVLLASGDLQRHVQRELPRRTTRREELDPAFDVIPHAALNQSPSGLFRPSAGTTPPPGVSLGGERVPDQVPGSGLGRSRGGLLEPLLEIDHQCLGSGHRLFGLADVVVEPGQRLLGNRLSEVGNSGSWRQADLLGFHPSPDHLGNAGSDLAGLVRRLVVAADIELGGSVAITVEDPGHSRHIHSPRTTTTAVDGHLDRLENVAVTIVLVVPDRVVRMVVTLNTGHRHRQECLGRVFDRIANPLFSTVCVAVANQEPGGSQASRIERYDLVASQHLHGHPLVTLVRVQRFDHPVTPVPDVLLAESDLALEPVPVAVTPDVQPVPPPSLPVVRAGQQPVNRPGIGIR